MGFPIVGFRVNVRALPWKAALLIGLFLAKAPTPGAQSGIPSSARAALDEVLDMNVRDGLVYYRALKQDRSRIDRYVASIAGVSIGSAPRNDQLAFWLNAYNALVLRTVIDRYPISRRSTDYPARSIRQIPGAFERQQHRIAGRIVTLDQIEKDVLPSFGDPRVFFALGRGAVGSGRLRSEAFTGSELERQLASVAAECVNREECVQVDPESNLVLASSIFSWREQDFVAVYADQANSIFSTRSPIERAILAYIEPHLLRTERAFVEQNEFAVQFIPFDWNLNDLTGR